MKRRVLPFLFLMVFLWSASSAHSQDTENDVAYVAGGGGKQQLDLYLPATTGFPTVLLIHGGSLQAGDRRESPFPEVGKAFQRAGVACAVMSYRLQGESPWPAQPQDAAAAFAWLKKNIASRGGDPRKVFVMGHSSGGHLTALIASDPQFLRAHALSPNDVAGAIPMGVILFDKETVDAMEAAPPERLQRAFAGPFRPYGNIEGFKKAWPYSHVGAHLPRFLIVMGDAERFQPPILARAEEFANAARKHGISVRIEVLPDRTHNSAIAKMVEANDPAMRVVLEFIQQKGPTK